MIAPNQRIENPRLDAPPFSEELIELTRKLEGQLLVGGLHGQVEWRTAVLAANVSAKSFLYDQHSKLYKDLRRSSAEGPRMWSLEGFVRWNEANGNCFGHSAQIAQRFYERFDVRDSLPRLARCVAELAARRRQAYVLCERLRGLSGTPMHRHQLLCGQMRTGC